MAATGLFGIAQFLVLFILGLGGVPLGYPPLPENLALLRAVPADSLALVQWFGSGPASQESPNAAVRLIAEQENRRFVSALRDAFLGAALRHEDVESAARIRAGLELAELVFSRPGVLFLDALTLPPRPETMHAGLILDLGPEVNAFKRLFSSLEPTLLRELIGDEVEKGMGSLKIGETTLHLLPGPEGAPRVAYGWFENYFIISIGDGSAPQILAGLSGGSSGLAGAPGFLALHGRVRVEQPAWRSWIDLPALVDLFRPFLGDDEAMASELLARLGLDALGPFLSETGLEGVGCVSRALVGLEGAPRGLFRLLQAAPLSDIELSGIPGDATLAAAFRLSPATLFTEILQILEAFPPGVREEFTNEAIGGLERAFELRLYEDLLVPLGDAWCLWNSPSQGGLVLTGLTLSVSLSEPDRFGATFDRVMRMLMRASEEERRRSDGSQRRGVWLDSFEFLGRTVWHLSSVGQELPVAPAWCIDGGRLLAALYPQMIKAELSRPTTPTSSLAAHPALRNRGEALSIGFLDLKEIVRLGWPLLTIGAQLLCDELQEEGFDLDLSILPSAAALLPHLGPQISTLERVPEGFRQTVRGSLPTLDAGIGLLFGTMSVGVFSLRAPVGMRMEATEALLDETESKLLDDLLRLGTALQAFQMDHGNLPQRLEELWAGEDKYLVDPLHSPSGKPYIFRPAAEPGQVLLHAPEPYLGKRAVLRKDGQAMLMPEERFQALVGSPPK